MPFFQNQSRSELRAAYVAAWRKHREQKPMEPLEAQLADVIAAHPEYHRVLEEGEASLHRDWTPEQGESNPFLHMGLHLAVRDQIGTDRPRGIRAVFEKLAANRASPHEAEHEMIECLAQALWDAQRSGRPPDEQAYLAKVRGLD
jgi:hypothetical protein